MNYWINGVAVFISALCADVCWTMYFEKIAQSKSISAGLWGSMVLLCGAFSVTEYVNDHSLIVFAIIGSFIGTVVTVEYNKRKKIRENKIIERWL